MGKGQKETETSEDDSEDNEHSSKCQNPYLRFLNQLAEDEHSGMMSGLQSWLGFAGSMTGTGSSILNKSRTKNPWVKKEIPAPDETLQKAAEDRMHKISTDFCIWMRNLPGEDKSVNETSEETISALFDTAISANPGRSAIGEGLKSWATFGSSVTGTDKSRNEQKPPFDTKIRHGKLKNKEYVDKLFGRSVNLKNTEVTHHAMENNLTSHQLRKDYGAWYLEPKHWNSHYRNQRGKKGRIPETVPGEKMRAEPPGEVNMMGLQQPVSQLMSTTAFDKYLRSTGSYKTPTFLKHIFKNDS